MRDTRRIAIKKKNHYLIRWFDRHERIGVWWISIVDSFPKPDPHHTIHTDRHHIAIFKANLRNSIRMAGASIFATNLELNQSLFPHQNVSPFAAGQNMAVFHRIDRRNVTDFRLTEAADVTLQLQSGKCFRYFPKLNVTLTAGGQLVRIEQRKHDAKHNVLR